jgi:hypothetical protein
MSVRRRAENPHGLGIDVIDRRTPDNQTLIE